MRDERNQDNAFAELCVLQAHPTRKSWFCIDNETSRAFLRELVVLERKERLKLRQWQTDNSKMCFHSGTINDPAATKHPILAPIFHSFFLSVRVSRPSATGVESRFVL